MPAVGDSDASAHSFDRGRHAALLHGRRERAGAGWGAARGSRGTSAAGAGSAALCGAHRRLSRLAFCADHGFRSACAADGGPADGCDQILGQPDG